MSKDPESSPADFSLRYTWCEGSVPPPDYYEYKIRVGPGLRGEIVFLPDYSMHDPPVWTERFVVDDAIVDDLYRLMVENGVFRRQWTEREDAPVGGSLEWLEVTANGERFKVPSVLEEPEAIADLYTAIRSLVPEAIWAKLMTQRAEFEQRYLEERG